MGNFDSEFNYENKAHLQRVNEAVKLFNNELMILQRRDAIISGSCALWLYAYYNTALLTATISTIVLFSCLYSRPERHATYMTALEELYDVYDWVMVKNQNNQYEKLGVKEIQQLILAIGPCISKDKLVKWQESDLKLKPNLVTEAVKQVASQVPVVGEFFKKGNTSCLANIRHDFPTGFAEKLEYFNSGGHMNTWFYHLYGENSVGDYFAFSYNTLINPIKNCLPSLEGIGIKL